MKNTLKEHLWKRIVFVFILGVIAVFTPLSASMDAQAKGANYVPLQDVYYTKANCVVYAEPTYESTVLTILEANLPVSVIGFYSNGWYRINIGIICYVKVDSLTTAGAIGLPNSPDSQVLDAQKTAVELGYEFVYLKLNGEKLIEKEIFNSYVNKKVILYAKVDDELGISFKMLYNDEIKQDIDLSYTKSAVETGDGREVTFVLSEPTELKGQIAIYQFKVGYDKRVAIAPVNPDY